MLETLYAVLQVAFRAIDARAGLSKNIGLTEREFLSQVFANIDTTGTELEKPVSASQDGEPMRQGESVLQRRVSLAEMLDSESFTEVVKGFVELYRVGIKVFDEKGGKLADIKIGNGDFCGYVFSFPEGRRRCTATVGRVKDGPVALSHGARLPVLEPELQAKGMITVPCFTGLRYLIEPITWEGDILGRVVFGPFMPEDLTEFPPRSLAEVSEALSPSNARQLVEKVRRAPESTIGRVMLHFGQLLQTMLFAGQKMFLTTQLHIEATLEQNRELEERNKSLEEANVHLKELDRLKSAFLATVSHELRTPLTSIIGYSEMLAEGLAGALNEEQVDYVRTIMEKGETLLKLISSILDISQIEAGKVRLNFEPMDVLELVTSSVSSLKPQAQKKGVILEAKLPSKMARVTGDRDRLRQVVVNLLANAVKFTPKAGSVSVVVTDMTHQPDLNVEGLPHHRRRLGRGHRVRPVRQDLPQLLPGRLVVDARVRRRGPGARHREELRRGPRGRGAGGERDRARLAFHPHLAGSTVAAARADQPARLLPRCRGGGLLLGASSQRTGCTPQPGASPTKMLCTSSSSSTAARKASTSARCSVESATGFFARHTSPADSTTQPAPSRALRTASRSVASV